MPPKKRTLREFTSKKKSEEEKGESPEDAEIRRDEFIKNNLYDSEDELFKKYTGFFSSDPFYSQFTKRKNVIESGFPRVLENQKRFQKEEEKKIKKEAEDRERDFFTAHKDDKDDVFLEEYKIFAYNDPYYINIFSEENPPTLDYIKKQKYYYYRKFDMPKLESTREFFKDLLTEKDPYVLKEKFKEYINRDDVEEILKTKFRGKNLSVVGIRYKIEKYLKDFEGDIIPIEERKKYLEIQKTILNILLLFHTSDNFKDKIKDYMENTSLCDKKAPEYSEKVCSVLDKIINSGLSDEDLKDMINRYLVDTEEEGSTIYIEDYFKEYLTQYRENLPEFKEEQKIKKFLREIAKLINQFNVSTNQKERTKIWIEIQNKIKEFKNEEGAPETRKIIFDKLDKIKSYSGLELYSKAIKNYLKQYYDLKEGKIKTYKNFDVFLDDFINSAETAFYIEREKIYDTLQKERMEFRESVEKEKLEIKEMSKYDKPIRKVLTKEVFETYNEPVQNDVIDFSKIKLSDALLKVARLPEYDLNSEYIKEVIENIKNTTTNTYEFLNKVITLITYLSNEVNNIVKFNYKANIGNEGYFIGTNNSFFIINVKKLFYLPKNLSELSPNDMLSNVFYNTSIPEEKRKSILQGIQKFIDKTMEDSIISIIKTRKALDIKNIHMRTYKIPAKPYTYRESLSLEPLLVDKLFINIEDNEDKYKNVAKSSYNYLLFEDESQNFEYDNVFYNEEYSTPIEIENSDGTKATFYEENSEIYRFQNNQLWDIIQKRKIINPESYLEDILNPYSGRVLNPAFIKEFENVYQTKLNEKFKYEEEVEIIKKEEENKKVEDIREVEELPDLLQLINEDLALILSKKNESEGASESKSNIERDSGDKIESDKLISILVNNNKKTYFIILNRNKNDVIKYIYNIHDNSLEKIPDKEKDEVKNSESDNFYTLLYFQDSNKKVKPSFTSDNNDHALIIESIKDIKNEIKNDSGQDIIKFLSDITNNTSYSTIDDVKNLKVIFDDKNKPLISFEETKNIEKDAGETEIVEVSSPDSSKKYIAFMYEYKDDKNNTCNNMVIFTKEGFYISSVYDINNEDFIDKDEERGILKSDILKDSKDIKKDLEQYKNNIYSTIYLKKNKLQPCSNELITKYLDNIAKNKNIKGNGNLEKYINELDNSLGVDFDKIEIEIDSEKIPNFRYKGTDCINNEKIVTIKKVETKPDTQTKSETTPDDKLETKYDSDNSSISSSDGSGSDSDTESVTSTSKSISSEKVTGSVTCVNCTKEISVDDALKSVVPNKQEEFDTIYFCSFPCFEKYDVWPSVKKIKK